MCRLRQRFLPEPHYVRQIQRQVYTSCHGQHNPDLVGWLKDYDVSKWGFFLAFDRARPIGGATVAIDTPAGMTTPFEAEDIAALWDIRVHSDERRRGIGSKLFKHVAEWAMQQGCQQLKIETQNVNVPACRFYAKQGCELGAIHRYGYAGCPDVAHEAILLWYLKL